MEARTRQSYSEKAQHIPFFKVERLSGTPARNRQCVVYAADCMDDSECIHCLSKSKCLHGAPTNINTCIIILMRVCLMKSVINMCIIRKTCVLWSCVEPSSRRQLNTLTNTRFSLAALVFQIRSLLLTRTSKIEQKDCFNIHLFVAFVSGITALRLYIFILHEMNENKAQPPTHSSRVACKELFVFQLPWRVMWDTGHCVVALKPPQALSIQFLFLFFSFWRKHDLHLINYYIHNSLNFR